MQLLSALDGGHDRRTITVADETLTFEQLAERVDAVGARVAGARVAAVRASATLDTVIAVVAALRAGVAVVPVAHDAGVDERRHVLGDSGAELVLGAESWDDVSLPLVPVDGAAATSLRPSRRDDRDLGGAALIMYTSGTTGAPKGVLLPPAAIAACLDGLAEAWAWTPDDHLVHGLPLFHVHGLVLGVLGALRVGCSLTHTGRPTPEAYAAAADAGGTLFFGVPTVWSRVVAQPEAARRLSAARLVVSGSAALPVPVFEALRQLTGAAPVERYGMTETLITLTTRADGERRPGHVGLPIAGVETRIRADDGTIAPNDGATIGTLETRGATVSAGYLGRAEATAASTTDDGWFITGDSATIGPDGFHRIVGRTSVDIIKSGGYKIGAGEVEAAISQVPGVAEVAVVGMPDPDLGERVVAFVVLTPDGHDVSADAVIDHVAAHLSIHKRPREVRLVDDLPRNAMGKLMKSRIPRD